MVLVMNKAPLNVQKQSLRLSGVSKQAKAPFADKIPFIRSLILDSVKPGVIKKIYLFGSYAYGKPTKNSDVDLCVVIGNRFATSKQYVKMKICLSNNDIYPLDLLVFKESQFNNITNPNGVKNTIATKGKVLYG